MRENLWISLKMINQSSPLNFDPAVESKRPFVSIHTTLAVCLTLALLQLMDGVLTSFGIKEFGISAEGNPLLRGLMQLIGPVPALITVKIAAVLVVCILGEISYQVSWVLKALIAVAILYLFAAVLPWTYILLF